MLDQHEPILESHMQLSAPPGHHPQRVKEQPEEEAKDPQHVLIHVGSQLEETEDISVVGQTPAVI
jgi:hypothetical protein